MFDKSYNSPEENASSTADILQAWLPKSGLKIAGGQLRGDTADLEVEGEMFPGTNALYLGAIAPGGRHVALRQRRSVGMLR